MTVCQDSDSCIILFPSRPESLELCHKEEGHNWLDMSSDRAPIKETGGIAQHSTGVLLFTGLVTIRAISQVELLLREYSRSLFLLILSFV